MTFPYVETTVPDPLDGAFSGSWLMAQNFPPTRYVVDGIIPEGFSMLVAAPKIGKSWMVLGLAVATATGGHAFGSIPVRQAPVLYLALEDGQKRLQKRLRHMGQTDLPTNLLFLPQLTADALSTIEAFMERHAGEDPLVILDTLGKVMPPARMGQSPYSADYAVSGALRDLTGRHPGSALIAVHHTRKAAADDFTQASSGTQGLTGGADTILVLSRNRQEGHGTLAITSRDAEENEYAISFHPASGQWTLDGQSRQEAAESARRLRSTEGMGEQSRQIVEYVNGARGPVTPAEVADALGMDNKSTATYLSRLAERHRIDKIGWGKYASTTVESVESVEMPDAEAPSVSPPTLENAESEPHADPAFNAFNAFHTQAQGAAPLPTWGSA